MSTSSSSIRHDLDVHYPVAKEQILFYQEQGFVKLRNVLAPYTLSFFDREITWQVIERNTMTRPLNERTTYEKAFLQVTNLWTHSETVQEFVFGKKLARIAAQLMGVSGVRLYHDQALYKEPSGGFTPWHADQYYWPLSSDRCVTAWIPLQDTPLEMGPLAFSAGSHKHSVGRDLEISDESESRMSQSLLESGLPLEEGPYALGDVSFHSGWTFHRAGPNRTTEPRRVMTIIYIENGMRLAEPVNNNQVADWLAWMPGTEIGQPIQTHLNPVLYHE